jgi:hypothetical protein
MEKQLKALEKRVAKLEKASVLFEEHRQAAIDLNRKLKKLKQEMDRDNRKALRHEERLESERQNRRKRLGKQINDRQHF